MNNIKELAWIIGIVDGYGAIHSHPVLFHIDDPWISHDDIWPGRLKRWRWSASEGLMWNIFGYSEHIFDDEERESIISHLERYGLNRRQIFRGVDRGL